MGTAQIGKYAIFAIGGGVVVIGIVFATLSITASDNISSALSGRFLSDVTDTRCPNGMVFVSAADGFCIDRYEVSPSDECLFSDPATISDTQVNIDSSVCMPESKPDSSPWRYISQHQAVLACAKAGKHLATNDEWYAAALGTPDNGSCNTRGASGSLELTGALSECVSSSGAHDMIGNAWEWVDEIVIDGEIFGRKLPEEGYVAATDTSGIPLMTDETNSQASFYGDKLWLTPTGSQGVLRGGAYGNETDAGVYAFYAASPPTFAGAATGFRCAQ